ncbi:hypothetical protein D3C86_1750700 [compost metagenome]
MIVFPAPVGLVAEFVSEYSKLLLPSASQLKSELVAVTLFSARLVGIAQTVAMDFTLTFFNPIIDDEFDPSPLFEAKVIVKFVLFGTFSPVRVTVRFAGLAGLVELLKIQFNPVTDPKEEVTVQLGVLDGRLTIWKAW